MLVVLVMALYATISFVSTSQWYFLSLRPGGMFWRDYRFRLRLHIAWGKVRWNSILPDTSGATVGLIHANLVASLLILH